MPHKDNALPSGVKDSPPGAVVAFSLYLSKVYFDKRSGEYRWVATCSNTQEDAYKTHMTVDLFRNFIQRIEQNEEAPKEYRSEYWSGGLPYLSIAHYEDLGGWASAGEATDLYIDGDYLKAKGIFADTDVGRALFRAAAREVELRPSRPIRISIAFLDYGHRHGQIEWERKSLDDVCPMCQEGLGDIYFTKGLLVHLAATRVPANEDTGFGLEERSMPITRKDDAESIVGEDLAERMEKQSILVGKSAAMVVRQEGDTATATVAAEDTQEKPVEEPAQETPAVVAEKKSEVVAEAPTVEAALGGQEGVPESVDYPFGGAVTMEAVRQFLVASNQAVMLSDIWTYAEECMYNIVHRPDITDKVAAIKELMAGCSAEWKKVMEVQESLTVEDPVDGAFVNLRSRMSELRDNPQVPAPADKLVALQETFDAFGEAVKGFFQQPENTNESSDVQALLEPLREENRSLRGQVEELTAAVRALQLSQRPVPETRSAGNVVPTRRSVCPTPVKSPPKSFDPSKPRSVREIVRGRLNLPV